MYIYIYERGKKKRTAEAPGAARDARGTALAARLDVRRRGRARVCENGRGVRSRRSFPPALGERGRAPTAAGSPCDSRYSTRRSHSLVHRTHISPGFLSRYAQRDIYARPRANFAHYLTFLEISVSSRRRSDRGSCTLYFFSFLLCARARKYFCGERLFFAFCCRRCGLYV